MEVNHRIGKPPSGDLKRSTKQKERGGSLMSNDNGMKGILAVALLAGIGYAVAGPVGLACVALLFLLKGLK